MRESPDFLESLVAAAGSTSRLCDMIHDASGVRPGRSSICQWKTRGIPKRYTLAIISVADQLGISTYRWQSDQRRAAA